MNEPLSTEHLERTLLKRVEALADQVNELTIEVAMLRESIVTAAEWDLTARQTRQVALDATLASVQSWLRMLIGVIVVLIGVVVGLIIGIVNT